MHDFGFRDLRVVNDFPVPLEAAKSAIDASEVLAATVATPTIAEAIADCTLVLGTTAVGERDLQHPLLGLADAAPHLRIALTNPDARIALLFGSEKTGLSNEELSHCDLLLTIPMEQYEGMRHPSMNLGQAVAVCLWELVRPGNAPEPAPSRPADVAEIERVYDLLYEMLEQTEYTRRHVATADPAHIRRLVHRMALQKPDVPAWLGILRQTLWKLRS
ncbi:tRNA:Cm32/Um32 methyltransferase [Granulicella sibirica]|uniref:tRNA:Cm32/Um32 methyltransferase n=2 Tax=Granulicella sibirica TaxID=2479048 RepID=A0A4Q0T4Y4_9BACT|nr:tRNA:Cm32/Um32 methyltransferase [Granulicella sibirica]